MSAPYDSEEDTLAHQERVATLMRTIIYNLQDQSSTHDNSKLESPEKEIFDEFTPKLKSTTYGSDEYKDFLKEMKVALDHHYAHNRHHPEYFENGIQDMTLLDLIEMRTDWKAATERHADGNLANSIETNKRRFDMPLPIVNLLVNTAKHLGWFE